MKNISQIAGTYASELTYIERDNKKIVITNNPSPELLEYLQHAHKDSLPIDWIYEKFLQVLVTINDNGYANIEELNENLSEITASLVDIYNTDLTSWLASNLSFLEYTDRIFEGSEPKDTISLLKEAQYLAIYEIAEQVVSLIALIWNKENKLI